MGTNPKTVQIGNCIFEIPESSSMTAQAPNADVLIAERGNEAVPIQDLPAIPNPNSFISANFQLHAMSKVGSSDKKWINTTGLILFAGIPFVLGEFFWILLGIRTGSWWLFFGCNAALLLYLAKIKLKK